MPLFRKLITLTFPLIVCSTVKAQLQFDYFSLKGYGGLGYGAFLNTCITMAKAGYATVEFGFDFFNKEHQIVYLPSLQMGYRHTLNGSGAGFYLEINAGYTFARIENLAGYLSGYYTAEALKGPAAGIGTGYLFKEEGKVKYNLGLRYEHTFGHINISMFSLRATYVLIW